MNASSQELRIDVHGVRVGMYVSRLDRPWINTPFLLEGFLVSSSEEIEDLQRYCKSVYVDVTRGQSPELRYVQLEQEGGQQNNRNEFAAMGKTLWKQITEFEDELPKARDAHKILRAGIEEIMEDLRQGHSLQLSKLSKGVDAMVNSITRNPNAFGWLREIKRKDNYVYHHALSCSVWAASFGRHLGLIHDELTELTLAGLLFDVGKTRLPLEMLNMRGRFSDEDHAVMQTHVQHSLDILEKTSDISPKIIEAVATHHERHDGSGYPNGLSRDSIPIYGRILGLIDSYDAMTSIRPHMPSRSPHQAVMDLYESRGTLFQPELVEQFIQTSGIYPTGSLVELTDGQVGVVTTVHNLKRLRPTVMLLLDAEKQPLKEFNSVNLAARNPAGEGYALGIKSGLPQGAFGIDPTDLFID
ncbi:HD-GYP domain-containing protein [Oleiagrimonas sp.]|jgi:HD-GYP domain-containing protein (c-di-GMP phosphodiesterase class II)|uniref:HD-GYP domain-containing protein n=1 Tax=Oleiagrimonas sp. TaxID=2010330 RepID=UPI00260F0360|nr:HD-GYP domain-containing protein [Oleiagrimonas sp.]MDA3912987.1 HD-GYP domain-containing protein [Oleiagrimonas sp.]